MKHETVFPAFALSVATCWQTVLQLIAAFLSAKVIERWQNRGRLDALNERKEEILFINITFLTMAMTELNILLCLKIVYFQDALIPRSVVSVVNITEAPRLEVRTSVFSLVPLIVNTF